MLRLIRKYAEDRSGSAALDFVVLLPIMLTLFIGVVEVTNILRLDRKVVAAAQTTADLITQQSAVSNAQLSDILRAAELVLEPYPIANHSVGIAAVRFDDSSGAPVMDWQESKNGGTVPNALTMAVNMGQPGEGVVIVRVSYNYSPVFFDFILGSTSIEETSILRPRRSSVVEGPAP